MVWKLKFWKLGIEVDKLEIFSDYTARITSTISVEHEASGGGDGES